MVAAMMPHCVSRPGVAGTPDKRGDFQLACDPGGNAFFAEVAERKKQRVHAAVPKPLYDSGNLVQGKRDSVFAQIVNIHDFHMVRLDRPDQRE